ncbi:hypothetical protein DM860_004935 [Cuscuta australis]|uniref:Growth-regulating factor n=1 Tax=Cuscuta australis TaxID=267555 RepID=A0A328DMF0_9ASTE|nr:hypothetical protein DM860_004935 [Cuscuta australis]
MDFALMTPDNGTAAPAGHLSAYNNYALLAEYKPGSGDPPGGDGVRTHGSMHPVKQERSGPPSPSEESRRPSKAPTFLLRSAAAASGVPGKPPTMLSFSSASEEIPFLSAAEDSPPTKSLCYPFLQAEQKRAAPHSGGGATGYGAARGWSDGSRGGFGRPSGPFTPPQWMELEHQALIYKHLVANVPIPSNLLIPIAKALNPYSFSGLTSASSNYASNWGWSVGLGSSNDPEPGRCRRTDGKKWRCSRDAVADQKYCERHINRGRHRSRKPVEGLTGRTVSGSAAPSSKVSPPAVAASAQPPAVAISCDGGGASNSLGALKHHHQFNNNTHPNLPNLPTTNRGQGVPVTYPSVSLKDTQEHNYPYKDMMGYGFLSSSESGQDGDQQHRHPVRHFMDGWVTKEQQSTRGPVEPKPDWTQLSMSIPMEPKPDERSSNSSLRPVQKTSANGWIPAASWGNNINTSSSSMGGPLGEVLINSTYGSSPTGVLGGSTFVSRSNSSSGSSPPPRMR